jgi:hypothetical protein
MTWHLPKRWALAATALCCVAACGGSRSSAAAPAEKPAAETPPPEPPALETEESPPIELEPALAPVSAGQYRLSLSTTCKSRDKTAKGKLTLSPVSGVERAGDDASLESSAVADGTLLWGKTDLDLERFLSCLGPSKAPGEPIHPGVLVEVLRWDGTRHHQVLLVSTDSPRGRAARSAVGVAMWVDRVDGAHIGGVWSRWELMDEGEGHWDAELVSPR